MGFTNCKTSYESVLRYVIKQKVTDPDINELCVLVIFFHYELKNTLMNVAVGATGDQVIYQLCIQMAKYWAWLFKSIGKNLPSDIITFRNNYQTIMIMNYLK